MIVNEEWERIWKGVTACLRHYSGICLNGIKKITKPSVRIVGVPAP
jgi:hypothetical protein